MDINKPDKYLWIVEGDTLESYESWPFNVGLFNSEEDANRFIKENPFDEEDRIFYLTPQKIPYYFKEDTEEGQTRPQPMY